MQPRNFVQSVDAEVLRGDHFITDSLTYDRPAALQCQGTKSDSSTSDPTCVLTIKVNEIL